MKTIAIAAVAGLAAAASAQETFSLSIVGAPATVDTTSGAQTISFDIVADSSFGTHVLGGSFAVESNNGLVTNMTWDNNDWDAFPTDGGFAGNGNYNQVIFGQLVIPGLPPFDVPGAGSERGGSVGSFQVELAASGTGVIDFQLTEQQPFSLQVIDMNTGASPTNADAGATLSLGSVRVNVVPAPSAMALLGLGGIAAGRRRR